MVLTLYRKFTFNNTTYGANDVLNETGFNLYGYLASNPDLLTAFKDNTNSAAQHYLNHGYLEGRTTTDFNPTDYLNNYADLSAAFGNDETLALQHYIQSGYAEGRTDSSSVSSSGSTTASPTALSNLEALQYIASNPDLIGAFGTNIDAAKVIILITDMQKEEYY